MDNREAIEAVGARVLYLPPYHPEPNPIELAWSKWLDGRSVPWLA